MFNEKVINTYIARAMQKLAPNGYEVRPEDHGQARKGATVPDIVVRMPYGLKMIIETEYGKPAIDDAKQRLGYEFEEYSLPVKNVIALGIPKMLGNLPAAGDVEDVLDASSGEISDPNSSAEVKTMLETGEILFPMQVVTGTSPEAPVQITPSRPILVSLRDLLQYAWLSAIPESYVQQVIRDVTGSLQSARKSLLDKLRTIPDNARIGLIKKYGIYDSNDPLNSVASNVIGTLTCMVQLHYSLQRWGQIANVLPINDKSLWQKTSPGYPITQRIAVEWRKIEEIDYKPLSTIALEMLENSDIYPYLEEGLLIIKDTIDTHLNTLSSLGTASSINGEIWQALIPDRDERAAYYTKPTTAEILANLTVARLPSPVVGAKYNEVCAGTGTLARAVEENIRFRHYSEVLDGNKKSIHKERITNCIQLTDINPQSISVATANLVSLEPGTPFDHSAIFAITKEGGALDFLTFGGVSNMGNNIMGAGGRRMRMLCLNPSSADICCNNDPYFRARGGASSPIDSKNMQKYKRLADKHLRGVADGQAGLATFMHVIEHISLRNKRPHGKVLPLTAARAKSYEGFRRNIETEYEDVVAISTAAGDGISMSADTDKQEMLLIGTKTKTTPKSQFVTCVNLTRTFQSRLEAKMYADAIRRELSKGKDSGEIMVGETVGTYFRMPVTGDGKPWYALGAGGDYGILTDKLTKGEVWNPQTNRIIHRFNVPMSELGEVAVSGPTHHLIGSVQNSRNPSGAFTIQPKFQAQSNAFMWSADQKAQTMITCVPTNHGIPRAGKNVTDMLKTANNFHISRNLRLSSQSIAVAYTEQAVMGGRAWNTLRIDPDLGKAITIFLNSTYGLLMRVGYAQITDPGRAPIQVRALSGHPLPKFDANALKIASEEFERLRKLKLNRVSLSVLDDNRAEMDRVATRMLGIKLSPTMEKVLHEWRKLMCQQPIVHGNNKDVLKELRANNILEKGYSPGGYPTPPPKPPKGSYE